MGPRKRHKKFLRVWGSPVLFPSPESTLALGSSLWPQGRWNSSLPAREGTEADPGAF